MENRTLTSYLKLIACEGLGVLKARQLLEIAHNVDLIFEADYIYSFTNEEIPLGVKNALLNFDHHTLVAQEIKFIKENHIQWVGILDADYPKMLKECIDAPIVLFYKGNLSLANHECLAIVGSRKMTGYGKEMIQYLTEAIATFEPTIVSGMAYGVDVSSYHEAVKNKLPFIAVMGTSFKTYYPSSHKKYYNYLIDNGLILTEYAGFNTHVPELFTRRNRIIAGLCKTTVVVESALKGGSLSTAYFANEYNREVYAFPGRVHDVFSAGCLKLIRENRAHVLYNIPDLIEDLNWNTKPEELINTPIKRQINFDDYTDIQQLILRCLENNELHIDDLALQTNLDMSVLNAELLILELDGVVKGLQGKRFQLK